MRRIHRSDTSKTSIVDGLRRCGYAVFPIERPCDLLVGKTRFVKLPDGRDCWTAWTVLEVKPDTPRKRQDQPLQDEFLAATGTLVVKTLEQALEALRGL